MERVRGYGYYDAKLAQERAARAGDVPVTVLRATQFHEFPAQVMAQFRLEPFAVVPRVVAVSLPGKAGRGMRAGTLLSTAETAIDGPTFDEWLRSRAERTSV